MDFARDIRPIFKQSCVKCHSLDNPQKQPAADFRLDDKAAAMKGGETGNDLVPGDARSSLLYQMLLGPVKDGDQEIGPMPKAKKGQKFKPLPKTQIELIRRWIDEGAKWPEQPGK